MGYGGPHAAFFATKDEFKRAMPGRIIGVSIDRNKDQALRMALQTREQHIRREKATSNICTAQALLSIMAAAYGIYHGPKGILHIGQRTTKFANLFYNNIKKKFKVLSNNFFDTVTIITGKKTKALLKQAQKNQINLREIDKNSVSVSFDETTTVEDLNLLLKVFGIKSKINNLKKANINSIPDALKRSSKFLTHKIFNSFHSETEMLRYLKSLPTIVNEDLIFN